MLAAPEHKEMKGQDEVTWRKLRTVAHALMVHARVPEVYVHFALMYTTDHIFTLCVDAYSNIPKIYSMDNITTEKVMENWICSSPDSGKLTNFDGGI